MYAQFLRKREKPSLSARRSLIPKKILYGSVSIMTIAMIVASQFIHFPWLQDTTSQVMAQDIGTVIQSSGGIEIISNGRSIQTSAIQLNDQIILQKDANITILIDDSFQADIVGPARFEIVPTVQNNHTVYNLKFINGWKYVAVDSSKDTVTSDITIQTSQGVVIKNTREELNTHQKTSFVVLNPSNTANTTILNKSTTTLAVSHIDTEPKNQDLIQVVIQPEQIVQLSQPISTWSTLKIEDTQALTTAKENVLLSTIIPDKKDQTTPSANNNKDTTVSEEAIPELKEDQIYAIQQNLYPSFVRNDVSNILTYHFIGNKDALSISYANLYARLQRIANIIDISTQEKPQSLEDLLEYAQFINNSFETKYHNVDSKLLYNLRMIIKRLQLIDEYKFAVYKNVNSTGSLYYDELIQLADLKNKVRQYKFR